MPTLRPPVVALLLLAAISAAGVREARCGTAPRWELGAGAAALSLPDYRGSDERRGYLLPLPWIVYRLDRLKVDRNGIRSIFFESDRAELNLAAGASPPVRSDDNRAREGMDDLKPLLEAGPSLDVRLWRGDGGTVLRLRLPVRAAFTLERHARSAGFTFSPALNLDVGGLGGGWNLGLLAGPVFGDRRQHEYFYGVPERDARAGRPAFAAAAGYGGTAILASLSRRFGKAWVGGYGRWDSLRGAVFGESPLVRRDEYASAGIAAAWIFSRSDETVGTEE